MKILVLASSLASDRQVHNYMSTYLPFGGAITYTVIRDRADWETVVAEKHEFSHWLQVGETDGWTALRVREAHGAPLGEKLLKDFFAAYATRGAH